VGWPAFRLGTDQAIYRSRWGCQSPIFSPRQWQLHLLTVGLVASNTRHVTLDDCASPRWFPTLHAQWVLVAYLRFPHSCSAKRVSKQPAPLANTSICGHDWRQDVKLLRTVTDYQGMCFLRHGTLTVRFETARIHSLITVQAGKVPKANHRRHVSSPTALRPHLCLVCPSGGLSCN
jgi:hypothetical protein